MIRSFRHRGLKLLYTRGDRSRIRPDLCAKIERILARLDQAETPRDMDIPGFRLHPLAGDLEGFWTVRVSRNHRIVFRVEAGHVVEVDLIDYH